MRRVGGSTASHSGTIADATLTARGDGGAVSFDGRDVQIDRTHGVSFILHGMSGTQVIPLHQIRQVKIQRANGGSRGYLQFRLADAAPNHRGGSWDENSVLFSPAQQAAFAMMARAIRRAMRETRRSIVVTSPQDPDEPLRLHTLREIQIITGDELASVDAGAGHQAANTDGPDTPATPKRLQRDMDIVTPSAAEARAQFAARWVREAWLPACAPGRRAQ